MTALSDHWNLIILGAVVVALYFWYISLVGRRNKVKEALAGIDVQLTKRHDLIPNILTIAQNFMSHETEIFSRITELRTQATQQRTDAGDPDKLHERLQTEAELQGAMHQLMVNVENYPALKSDTTMLQAQQTYNEVEEHIAAARRFYNSAVNDLNNAAQVFPGNLIAAATGIKPYPYYEAEEGARAPVNAADYLKQAAS